MSKENEVKDDVLHLCEQCSEKTDAIVGEIALVLNSKIGSINPIESILVDVKLFKTILTHITEMIEEEEDVVARLTELLKWPFEGVGLKVDIKKIGEIN